LACAYASTCRGATRDVAEMLMPTAFSAHLDIHPRCGSRRLRIRRDCDTTMRRPRPVRDSPPRPQRAPRMARATAEECRSSQPTPSRLMARAQDDRASAEMSTGFDIAPRAGRLPGMCVDSTVSGPVRAARGTTPPLAQGRTRLLERDHRGQASDDVPPRTSSARSPSIDGPTASGRGRSRALVWIPCCSDYLAGKPLARIRASSSIAEASSSSSFAGGKSEVREQQRDRGRRVRRLLA
jgi:hypothetical protein